MISPEKLLPYDRTLLTKALPVGNAEKFVLRDEAFLKNNDIDVERKSVYAVHADKKKLTFTRGDPMDYDKLLIATGGYARTPKIKGIDAKNVFNIRNNEDQANIKEKCKDVKDGIAIIGSSFIGSEAAASIKSHYKDKFDVHMIGLEQYPL